MLYFLLAFYQQGLSNLLHQVSSTRSNNSSNTAQGKIAMRSDESNGRIDHGSLEFPFCYCAIKINGSQLIYEQRKFIQN
jgi:hypothetical protein